MFSFSSSLNQNPSKKVRSWYMLHLRRWPDAHIRKNIYHARSSEILHLPTDFGSSILHAALHVYDRRVTNKGELFLLVNDGENHVVIFSTAQILRFMSSCDTIFVDGTFKSVPKLFAQFRILRRYVPLVFYLLLNKTIESYVAAFQHVVQESNKLSPLLFAPHWQCTPTSNRTSTRLLWGCYLLHRFAAVASI